MITKYYPEDTLNLNIEKRTTHMAYMRNKIRTGPRLVVCLHPEQRPTHSYLRRPFS